MAKKTIGARTIGAKGTKKQSVNHAEAARSQQSGSKQLPAVKKKPPVLGV
jgi:hypothetical protein